MHKIITGKNLMNQVDSVRNELSTNYTTLKMTARWLSSRGAWEMHEIKIGPCKCVEMTHRPKSMLLFSH